MVEWRSGNKRFVWQLVQDAESAHLEHQARELEMSGVFKLSKSTP